MVIWAILAAVGVPLWLCTLAVLTLVLRNRGLRNRPGDVVVRVRRSGSQRWTRAHAVWVSDVFIWRGSPAAWAEQAQQVTAAKLRSATPDELTKLRRLCPDHAIASMTTADGGTFDVATKAEHCDALLGPFAHHRQPSRR